MANGDCDVCAKRPHDCRTDDSTGSSACLICRAPPHQCVVRPIAKALPEKIWLTTYEAGRLIGHSPSSVRRLIEFGVWPSAYRSRPGADWRVKREDIEKWLEAIRPKKRVR